MEVSQDVSILDNKHAERKGKRQLWGLHWGRFMDLYPTMLPLSCLASLLLLVFRKDSYW